METEPYVYSTTTLQEGTERLLPNSAERILDLGGGRGGNGAVAKARTGASFLCVADLAASALDEHVAEVDATIACNAETPGALERVFAENGPFDLVLALDFLEHLADPWRVVARLHALMPMGGMIVASIPNVRNYRIIARALLGNWRYRSQGMFDRTHLRFFDRSSAIELMTTTGLELDKADHTYGAYRRDRQLDRLTLGLFRPFLTMQTQLRVRKTSEKIINPGDYGAATATAERN